MTTRWLFPIQSRADSNVDSRFLHALNPILSRTVGSWYFYQKTKNYRVLFSALKGGLVTGTRLASWTGLFVLSQEAVERFVRTGLMHSGKGDETTRGVKAFAGATAGVGLAAVAGSFCKFLHSFFGSEWLQWITTECLSRVDRLSKYTSGRRLMLGLGMGLLAGGTVDLRDWMRDKLEQEEENRSEVKMT